MLLNNWHPSDLVETERRWEFLKLPDNGEIDPNDASKLMIQYEAQAQDWADQLANAQLYEEMTEWEAKGKYHVAFLRSEATSDRKKEAEAKSNEKVRAAEISLIEAKAATTLAKMKHEGAVRSTHAMKAILRVKEGEKWL